MDPFGHLNTAHIFRLFVNHLMDTCEFGSVASSLGYLPWLHYPRNRYVEMEIFSQVQVENVELVSRVQFQTRNLNETAAGIIRDGELVATFVDRPAPAREDWPRLSELPKGRVSLVTFSTPGFAVSSARHAYAHTVGEYIIEHLVTTLSSQLKVDIANLKFVPAVRKLEIFFLKPMRSGEIFGMVSSIESFNDSSASLITEITQGTNVICSIRVILVALDSQSFLPVLWPPWFQGLFFDS